MHGFVKFLIFLLRSLLLCFVQYCKVKTIQCNACRNFLDYWITLVCGADIKAAWSAWHGSQLCVRNVFSVYDPGFFT